MKKAKEAPGKKKAGPFAQTGLRYEENYLTLILS